VAVAEYYQRYGTQIRCWIRLRGPKGRARSARGPEDVQQSVWLTFHAAAVSGKFRGWEADQIRNWLKSVTRHHLFTILRAELAPKRGGGRVVGLAAEPAGSGSGVVSALVRREARDLCVQALGKLDGPDRELLEDRYLHGLGVVELAEKYKVAPGTISKRVARAEVKFRVVFPPTPAG
jgi:RNA polymerase sigma factor (sigma-70 family)